MKKICFLIILILSLYIPNSLTWAKPKVFSLGESIKIDSLSITFESVKVAPSCASWGIEHGMAAVKKGYKCVVITAEAKNTGIREVIFDRTAPANQEYKIEVDKGYFYSSKYPGRALRFQLLPEETGEDYLMFHILKTTKPVRLHGRIRYKVDILKFDSKLIDLKFVIPLENSKFIYPKRAKISIEDYKIEYKYIAAVYRHGRCVNPAGYIIYHINPVIRNSGDLATTVTFEVEISGFKEAGGGGRGLYNIPSKSVVALKAPRPDSPLLFSPWHWVNMDALLWPKIPPGEHSLKITIKDKTGKVIADKVFQHKFIEK